MDNVSNGINQRYGEHKVPRRIAQTVINSLKGGVVPRVGLPYVTVGRKSEIEALLRDVDIIQDGGASFRFIVGKYGSGKSFMLQTIRNYVMDKDFVVMDADLSPERKLYGKNGQGLATYKELVRNVSTKTKPEGGALALILDRWISNVQMAVNQEATKELMLNPELRSDFDADKNVDGLQLVVTDFDERVKMRIFSQIDKLKELVHGFDFAKLLVRYYEAYKANDEDLKNRVLKWFRGEYQSRREAQAELGVSVIMDEDWYEYLKIFASFFRQAGYSGLLLFVDELVNLYKIPNSISRQYNYEKILMMYNDALQGKAHYIGTIMSGTPECIEDQRRGLYSYEALRSRLASGKFVTEGVHDMLAPVIKLDPLTSNEMYVLTEKLTKIHAGLYEYTPKVTSKDLEQFVKIEYSRLGAGTKITPREIIRDFIEILDITYQNQNIKIGDLLNSKDFMAESYEEAETGLTEFTL